MIDPRTDDEIRLAFSLKADMYAEREERHRAAGDTRRADMCARIWDRTMDQWTAWEAAR